MSIATLSTRALLNLPCIGVMGPENSGKSSLIARSGLQFTAVKHEALSDQCTWHFADEAVIWVAKHCSSTLLASLKHRRRSGPLSGVVVVLSVVDLQEARPEREQHLSELKQQLHDMVIVFKMRIPVHIILTHVDTIPGFATYFKALSVEDREQPWGFLIDDPAFDSVKASVDLLYSRIGELRVRFMQVHSDPEEVTALIQFPEQFINFMKPVIHCLDGLLSTNPYLESPAYKTIMLTGLDEGKSYFSKNLFKDFILKSWRSEDSLRHRYQQRFLRCAGLISSLLFCMVMLAFFMQSSRGSAELARVSVTEQDARTRYEPLILQLIEQYGTLNVSDFMTGDKAHILHSGNPVPVIFTKKAIRSKAMRAIVQAAHSDNKPVEKALTAGMMDAYFKDYGNAWKQFMTSMEVTPVYSFDHMREVINTLTSDHGPAEQILEIMKDNLEVNALSQTDLELKMDVKKLMADIRAQWMLLNRELLLLTASTHLSEQSHDYAQKVLSSSQNTGLEQVASGLSQVLKNSEGNLQDWIEPMAISPVERVWELILREAVNHLNRLWQQEVILVYAKTLEGKFPFAPVKTEASLEDVTHFLRPVEGTLSHYVQAYLQGYITVQEPGPVLLTWLGRGLPLSPEFLAKLWQGLRIGEGLFPAGGSEPSFTFYIAPVPAPGVEEIVFEHDGTRYRYRNEPEDWRKFTWPAVRAPISSGLYIARNRQTDTAELEYEGIWSVFHLLGQATITTQSETQYDARWILKTQQGVKVPVNIKIRADKHHNIIAPGALSGFEVPQSITQ